MGTTISRNTIGLIAVCGAVLSLAACGTSSSKDGSSALAATHAVNTAPPEPLVLGSCIDATDSVGKGFGANVRDRIADFVGDRIPAKPADSSNGVAAVAGLKLELRLVTTRPLSEGAPYVRIDVPAVPGLAPMPDISDGSALDASTPGTKSPYETWRDQKVTWDTDYDKALAKQKAAVQKVRSLSLNGGMSGITGCMSSLAQDLRRDGTPRYLLASDLQENVSAQLSGSLDNQPVFVIQPCPSGVGQTCDGNFKRMSDQLKQLHAGRIVRETQASADQAVAEWMKADS